MASWLDSNSTAVIALATIVSVVSTIALVVITFWYAKITREILKATNKPEILIYLFPSEGYSHNINLCIQNIGTGFASNIEFELTPSLQLPHIYGGDLSLEELSVFKNGIDYLPPGKKIEFGLFTTHTMGSLSEKSVNINVTYKDSTKEKHKESFLIDFSKWVDFYQSETPTVKAAESLSKIASEIGGLLRDLEYRSRN